ncbi:hypothetical protein [Methylobacterium sp. 77]|uniref:hypothetical protein n=1 Tax=Methylobacterium sp. 77 TaxID=1101192 RepID=UPI00036FAA28|nr:hypothetical protein [Methylobacterium sp. 77]
MTYVPELAATADDAAAVPQDATVDEGTVEIPAADVVEAPVTETLFESVSPAALLSAQAAEEAPAIGDGAIAETIASKESSLQAPTPQEPEAEHVSSDDTAAVAQGEDAAPPPIADSAAEESEALSESLLPVEIETAIASAQDLASQQQRIVPASALTEITAANDTLTAYVRNESIATFAHWRALSTAKNPADALRLQVSEMQRAADASLSCFASLARRAGRIAASVRVA